LVTRALSVRARLEPGPDGSPERLFDPLSRALASGEPLARERFATSWLDVGALRALAERKRAPLPRELAAELADYHRRLGASPASLAALERVSRGEAVCTIAGQQPAPLGGPLYALHKTGAAVGLAERANARLGMPCVPLYWTHVEDSDFEEIRGITVADAALQLHELRLPSALHADGRMVGGLPVEPVAELGREALGRWGGLPGHAAAESVLRQAAAAAHDLGELQSALMLRIFGERGLVVVDPRLPAFRAAARPWIDRYLVRAAELHEAVRRAGDRLEVEIGRRPLADASLDSFVFAIGDGTRRKVSVDEARRPSTDRTLSPSVALRPVVQDAVLPTIAMACGPGEIAYLAQLREVFEGLEVPAAAPVPRFSATWVPPAGAALIEASSADPWEVVSETDAVLKRLAEARVPDELSGELERSRERALAGLSRLAELGTRLDASLPQLVESARGKVDYQFARLLEGVIAKARHRLEREHPEWARLRYYLSPGGKTQERTLAALEPMAYRGAGLAAELCDLAAECGEALERGVLRHYLLDL
jgi:uncharacterized protein YllA (UPF0747 family)